MVQAKLSSELSCSGARFVSLFFEKAGGTSGWFWPKLTRQTQISQIPNTQQNRAPLMCLSGRPALKVRLAAKIKRDGNKWAWVVNVAPKAVAVWDERTCEDQVN